MVRRAIIGSLLVVACADDRNLEVEQDPVAVDCPCRLATVIDNLALCTSPTTTFAPAHVYSSSLPSGSSGAAGPQCEPWRSPQPPPAAPWSALRISAPCTGDGELCISVRGGDASRVAAEDCVLATRCAPFDYGTPGQVQELLPLAAWVAESSACATRFEQVGGYLEFSLRSDELGCGNAPDRTERVPICPPRCQLEPAGEGCAVCGGAQVTTWF